MLIPIAVSILVSFILTAFFRSVSLKFGIVDLPDKRKKHCGAVPLLGGAAVFFGVLSGILAGGLSLKILWPILLGSVLVLLISLLDDIYEVSAQIRIAVQLAAASVLIYFGMQISFLPNVWWGDMIEIFLTLLWVVGLTNAFNYLDGIDGLAAGLAAISGIFFAEIALFSGQAQIGLAAIVVASSCLGFLPYNLSKTRKVFLGDAGSTFLGFFIAGIALAGDWAENDLIRLAIPILILGVPIYDMVLTTILRIWEDKVHTIGEWLKYSGRDHFHHRLVDLGLVPLEAAFFIYLVNIVLGINAVIISYSYAKIVGILAVLQAAIVFLLIAILMLVGRSKKKD